ncbi:6-hydroxymethylpterin diphosphokinase MptE-like protein [Clostridium sp.]|uniref:motility associated factor glycosyltransferase family protein n=1 Tax=Clostridium sp. TaxID=1506 RepID=UPI00260A12C1|nr:6-hydroxymethylpterin diphosphokinase MptE-like protein [Clostridium sp.]
MSLNIELSKDGYKILKINKNGKKVYLGSKYNQQREVEKFINSIDEITNKDNFIILGLAFGEHVKELLKSIDKNSKILIIEFDNELIEYCKKDEEIGKIFKNKNINIVENENDIENFIIENITEVNVDRLQILYYCNYIKIYTEKYDETFTFIRDLVARIKINRNTFRVHGELFLENTIFNLPYIAKSTPANKMQNVYKNKPAIIVSAGPSLIKNIDELKGVENALILSGGRTLGALLERHIEPSCIGIVDPGIDSYKLVEPFINKVKSPLFFCDLANERVIKEHKADKIFYSNCKMIFDVFQQEIVNLYGGGSIAHSLTTFAIYMGCSPIILIGQDLAYTGDRGHSIDCGDRWDEKNFDRYKEETDIFVKDINGNFVRTSLVLNDFRVAFENIIKEYPNVKFINATEGGANIEGAENRKLKDVLVSLKKDKIKPMSNFIQHVDRTKNVINELENNLYSIKEYMRLCESAKKLLSEYKINYYLKKQTGVDKCIQKLNEIDKKIIEKNYEITLITTVILKIIFEIENDEKFMVKASDSKEVAFNKEFSRSNCLYSEIEKVLKSSFERIEKSINDMKEEC